jgi:glycosyltransferase involved in cell wall biosynthesis
MRICYDYQIFAAQKYGGISRYFVEIARRLKTSGRAEVRVVAPLYRCKLLYEKRSAIPVTGLLVPWDFSRATGLCSRIDSSLSNAMSSRYRPDIVHETYYSREQTTNSARKTVITVYDTIAELFSDSASPPPGALPVRKAAFERANHIICISHNTRADLIRLYRVDADKVSVIHLASSIALSDQPPISNPEPYFLFVGGRWGYKNFLGLAEAFKTTELWRTHKVICFGGGPFAAHELKRLNELRIPLDRFEIIDGDDELLSRYYASAVALVYPSLYEGFGIPLLEAMQCGCPVLCGNSSSLPEVAGSAAEYFDASDPLQIATAMLKMAGCPDEREKLIRLAKARVTQFSWDRCAEETYAVYERVLSD